MIIKNCPECPLFDGYCKHPEMPECERDVTTRARLSIMPWECPLRKGPLLLETTPEQLQPPQPANNFKGWPADQPLRYNACTEPCDMWTGPCACGAWHKDGV